MLAVVINAFLDSFTDAVMNKLATLSAQLDVCCVCSLNRVSIRPTHRLHTNVQQVVIEPTVAERKCIVSFK